MKSSSKDITPKPVESSSKQTRKRTILLVEDEPEIRKLLTDMLLTEGYTVVAMPDGEKAKEQALKMGAGVIDLLVADLVMPKLGGLQLASWFRDEFPSVKILIISGYTNEMVIFNEKLASNTAFLPKPLHMAPFKAKVAELLA